MDENTATNTRRLIRVSPFLAHSEVLYTFSKSVAYTKQWLVLDVDGNVVLASTGTANYGIARFQSAGLSTAVAPSALKLEQRTGELLAAPTIDAMGNTLVQRAAVGAPITTERRASLLGSAVCARRPQPTGLRTMRFRSVSMPVLLLAACADESNTGGSDAARDEECHQIGEWHDMTPHADYAACESPPNASCDRASFCAGGRCGGKDSSFDVNGCRRLGCGTDADCAAGQRCYDTNPNNSIDSPCAATEYACCPDSDGCFCASQTDCPSEKHCVDESEL